MMHLAADDSKEVAQVRQMTPGKSHDSNQESSPNEVRHQWHTMKILPGTPLARG
jgi:hypothetical protein